MEIIKKNNIFMGIWISCIVLLLVLAYFGVNSSVKKTYSVPNCDAIKIMSTCRTTTGCSVGTRDVDNGRCTLSAAGAMADTASGNSANAKLCASATDKDTCPSGFCQWVANVSTEQYCYYSGEEKSCTELGYYANESDAKAAAGSAHCSNYSLSTPINPTNSDLCVSYSCKACSDGYKLENGSCIKDTDSSSCVDAGYFATETDAETAAKSNGCSNYTLSNPITANGKICASYNCTACSDGYELEDGGSCKKMENDPDERICLSEDSLCPIGAGRVYGDSSCFWCRTCHNGQYCPNRIDIKLCPAGYYCPDGAIEPTLCPENHWCREGEERPFACPSDRPNSPSGSTSESFCTTVPIVSPTKRCWVCNGQYTWADSAVGCTEATGKTQANCSGSVSSGGGGGTGGGGTGGGGTGGGGTGGGGTGGGGTGGGNSSPSNSSNTGNNGNDDTGGNDGYGDNNNDNDNVNNNPQTGNIVIFMVWILGLVMIGYSVYYFKEIRNNE